jgi:uncharacterized protein (UPF0333 family)
MDKTQKKYLVIGGLVLLFLIILAVYFYKQGAKKTSIQIPPEDQPGSTSGNNNAAGVSNSEIKNLSNSIYKDIDGFNLFGHDNTPYDAAVLLSDTDIVRLYNAFNTEYQSKLSETLTQALINEKFWENSSPDTLIARLQKLNCK